MYLLGHVGSAILLYFLAEQYLGIKNYRNKLIIAFGSMLPDFIDKPIGSLIFHHGRWLGHSAIIQFLVFGILYLLDFKYSFYARFRADITLIYLGSIIHILGDMQSISLSTVFWPFLGPFPSYGSTAFLYGFTSLHTIITEVIGLMIICSIGYYERWERNYWLFTFTVIIGYVLIYCLALLIFVV